MNDDFERDAHEAFEQHYKIVGRYTMVDTDTHNQQQAELAALRATVDTLRAALEYYADVRNYDNYDEDGGYKRHADIEMDRGQQAREALAAVKSAGEGGE